MSSILRRAIPVIRELFRPLAGFVLLSLVSLNTGCSSPEERADYHLERGREYAVEGNDAAANIEFRAAFSSNPKNLAALIELADAAENRENPHDLRFYLQEALTLKPEMNSVALRLANVLREVDPSQARRLILSVVARDPKHANAQLALSKSEFSFKRINEALRIALLAIDLDPSDPNAHWHLGFVYYAMLQQSTQGGKPIDESLRSRAVDAFEAFIAAGGQPEWKARSEQARIQSTGSHNRAKALASAQISLESAREAEDDAPKMAAARHLAKVARMQQNTGAYADAITALLEITPRDMREWQKLAAARQSSGGSADAVYADLIALYPDDAEVHILYAYHIGRTQGYTAAAAYFNKQIDLGIDPPRMLAGLCNYETTGYRTSYAERTLLRLQRDFPDSPWTKLELARKLGLQAKTFEAVKTLESLLQEMEIFGAYEMLAKLERFHQHRKKAVSAARKAVAAKGYFEGGLHKLYSDILFEGGEYFDYLEALEEIERHGKLSSAQHLMKAQSLYETGKAGQGRKILLRQIGYTLSTTQATLEFARREAGNPKQQFLIRNLLSGAIAEDPKNRELIAALIYANVKSGRIDAASSKLEELAIERYPAEIQDLRAHMRAARGDLAGAQRDANLALRTDPLLPNLADFALHLYSKAGPMDRHLERLENWIQRMRADRGGEWLVNSRKIAQFHLMRSRMLRFEERNAEALEVLDFAIANHEYTIDTRTDRAYLIASTEDDPRRAIEIAGGLVERHGSNPHALHTLGFAYLRADKPFQALEFLRLANRNATSPNSRFLFQESVALRLLNRESEALELIEEVLALDPSFPEAAQTRRSLISAIDSE